MENNSGPKAKKIKKDIDYSKVSDEIWGKTWSEFLDMMNKIQFSLDHMERRLKRITVLENNET